MSSQSAPTTSLAVAPPTDDPPRETVTNHGTYSEMSRLPDAEDLHRFDRLSTPSNNLSTAQYDAAWYKDYEDKYGRPHVTDYVRIAAIEKEAQKKAAAEQARLAKAEQKKKQSLIVKLKVKVPEEMVRVGTAENGVEESEEATKAAAEQLLEIFATAMDDESDDEDEDAEY